ncbi:RING-type domain-containing protein [Trichostrongylus colubriformis]|uniref:RING-type domain-containing protein n=1 Tax=Trichostrongylus colubriformis TaxID=6319 RepID=A0AAN8IPZ6_TRICO
MTYRAKWFVSPSKKTGVVILKDARDQVLAKRILIEHGYFAELQEKNDDTNTMINIGCIPDSFQHDSLFEKCIREMLQVNGVGVKRVYLHRSYRRMHEVNETARRTVYRAIIDYLIRNHEWHHPYPLSIYEWNELLSWNLPWSWRLLDKNEDSQKEDESAREAELIFKDLGCGLRMMTLLTTDEKELNFSNGFDTPQRIVMKPIYCFGVSVTKEVRVACDSFIRRVNEEESVADDPIHSLEIVDKTWTADYQATDDSDTSEGELSVQGWPREHVEEVAMRLISYFEGTHIDCSGEENGKLLYGHGASYVELVRSKLRGKVVIDVDLLQERITLVGEEAETARKKLEYFVANSHAFVITQRLAIEPPRYLHFMRNALRFVGLEKLRAICGGAQISFVDMEHMDFHGTVQQYDLLMDFLQEVDEKLVTTSSKINTSSKPDCPICLSPVSNAFYCLDCGHYYCLKCIIHQVKTLIRNRELPLRCYHMDCGQLFSINDLRCLLLGDNRLPWLNAKKMHALIDSSIDCLLRKDKSLSRCPTPDCFGLFMTETLSERPVIECKCCKRSRCSSCMMEPHEGVSCEMYATLRSDERASLQVYLQDQKGKVRECPTIGCGALIEKGEGCNHMHCTVCNMHFCWLCGFSDTTQSKIYGHLRETHGAIGEEWPLFDNFYLMQPVVDCEVNDYSASKFHIKCL